MPIPELDIFLQASKRARFYLVSVHVFTALCWILLVPASWLTWPVLGLIVISGGSYLLPTRRGYTRLQWQAESWWLTDNSGRRLQLSALNSAYVSQVFLIMRFQRDDRRRMPLVLWPDMMDKNSFRRLRVYCRDPRFYRQ